jgi:methyltransferase (TIGR00027 family)
MTTTPALIRDVTDTARWTAAYRALETEGKNPLFRDPFARRLAGDRGFEIAAIVKSRPTQIGVTLRTAVFDRLIPRVLAETRAQAVLMLATGLDARPYRLDLPGSLHWVEVDLPELVAYKEPLLAEQTPRCLLERVPLDLSDRDARRALFADVAGRFERVLVIAEGLLGYLAPEDVASLACDLAEHPQFVEWDTDLNGSQVSERVLDAAKEHKAEGQAQIKFAPAENTAFFEPHGWSEREYLNLFEEAHKLGRNGFLGKALRFGLRFAPASKRALFERALGVVRLAQSA